jgi:hypothetical protein
VAEIARLIRPSRAGLRFYSSLRILTPRTRVRFPHRRLTPPGLTPSANFFCRGRSGARKFLTTPSRCNRLKASQLAQRDHLLNSHMFTRRCGQTAPFLFSSTRRITGGDISYHATSTRSTNRSWHPCHLALQPLVPYFTARSLTTTRPTSPVKEGSNRLVLSRPCASASCLYFTAASDETSPWMTISLARGSVAA